LGFTVASRRNLGMGMNTDGVLIVLHEAHEDGERREKERMREKREERERNLTNEENLEKRKYILTIRVHLSPTPHIH
jgi:hypothetical protein